MYKVLKETIQAFEEYAKELSKFMNEYDTWTSIKFSKEQQHEHDTLTTRTELKCTFSEGNFKPTHDDSITDWLVHYVRIDIYTSNIIML